MTECGSRKTFFESFQERMEFGVFLSSFKSCHSAFSVFPFTFKSFHFMLKVLNGAYVH